MAWREGLEEGMERREKTRERREYRDNGGMSELIAGSRRLSQVWGARVSREGKSEERKDREGKQGYLS